MSTPLNNLLETAPLPAGDSRVEAYELITMARDHQVLMVNQAADEAVALAREAAREYLGETAGAIGEALLDVVALLEMDESVRRNTNRFNYRPIPFSHRFDVVTAAGALSVAANALGYRMSGISGEASFSTWPMGVDPAAALASWQQDESADAKALGSPDYHLYNLIKDIDRHEAARGEKFAADETQLVAEAGETYLGARNGCRTAFAISDLLTAIRRQTEVSADAIMDSEPIRPRRDMSVATFAQALEIAAKVNGRMYVGEYDKVPIVLTPLISAQDAVIYFRQDQAAGS